MFFLQGRVKSAIYIDLYFENFLSILLKSFILAAFGCSKQNKQQTNKSQELYTNPNVFIKIIDMSSSYPSYSQAVVFV